jgi:hypothetical protein
MGSARIDIQNGTWSAPRNHQTRNRKAEMDEHDGRYPSDTYNRKDKYRSWKKIPTREDEGWDDIDDEYPR